MFYKAFLFIIFLLCFPYISFSNELPLYFTPKKFIFDNNNQFIIHIRLDKVSEEKYIYQIFVDNSLKEKQSNSIELSLKSVINKGLNFSFFNKKNYQAARLNVWFNTFQRIYNKNKIDAYFYKGIWILKEKDFNNIKNGCNDIVVYEGIKYLECPLWSANFI